MRLRCIAFRALNPSWSYSPTSGEGAKLHGGRFNPKGVAALYLSLTETTALAEYNQGFNHRPQPKTLCAYELDCDDMLDLSDEAKCNMAGTSLNILSSGWKLFVAQKQTPPTWDLATKLIEQGIAGIIVPSQAKNAPDGGNNIVLWRWSDKTPYQARVIDDNNLLPNNPDSWR